MRRSRRQGGITLGRRREESVVDQLFDVLKLTPVWVGPVLAAALFVVLRLLMLLVPSGDAPSATQAALLRPMLDIFSWVVAGAVITAWVTAEIWKLFNRRLLDSQSGIESIRSLSWRDFECLVSEAYRRKGYSAEVVGTASGDGGVDICLIAPGEKVLVQCKQWKAFKVGVTTVRELLGVVVSQKATKGVLVTSGRFTREAKQFARENPQIQLVDGPELADLVRSVQPAKVTKPEATPQPTASTPQPPGCPACGTGMVLRTARKGSNSGSQFWGCPKYPACRGTRPHSNSPASA
jgi:restriction system protein